MADFDKIFLSTLSLRRATRISKAHGRPPAISIHALLAESDLAPEENPTQKRISIHALLAESDPTASRRKTTDMNFYPRSPCGERPWQRGSRVTYVEFLSTLSLRRATLEAPARAFLISYFYPRSPCGERP